MRVLVAGNLVNIGFELTYALRIKKIEASLLLPKFPDNSQDPKSMYPQFERDGYPPWLVRYDNKKTRIGLDNWKIEIIKEMRKKEYDAIIALTEMPIFAIFSGKPFLVLSTGSDMRELALQNSLRGFLLRLAYKMAKKIVYGEPDKLPLLKKLNITKKAVFLNVPRNTKIFSEKMERDDLKDKFVIFHPASQDWRIKNNEIFLLAYDKLCSLRDDVHLILSDRGPDIEKAKKILSNGYAKNMYELLPFIPTSKLPYYYNLSNLVVDQFGVGSFGQITIESMKYSKPVLIKIFENVFLQCFKEMPGGIINASTKDEIFDELYKLVSNKELAANLGKMNKEWVDNYHNDDLLTEKWISVLKDVCKEN